MLGGGYGRIYKQTHAVIICAKEEITSPKNTFHNQGQRSSFSSKQVCFPKYPVPIASPLALKGGKTGLVWINTFSLSLSLFFFVLIFFYNHLARFEDQKSEQTEVLLPFFM